MIQLTITYGGTTLNLQTGGFTVLDGYYPLPSSSPDRSVADTINLWIKASDPGANIMELERAFEYARDHADRPDCAYITFAISETAPVYRSRLLGGVVTVDEKLQAYYRNQRAAAHVTIERAGYWEGPEAELTLKNPYGDTTGGVSVYNHWDSGHKNYVDIVAAQVGGNLQTPLKLQIVNNADLDNDLSQVFVGHNVSSDPTNLVPTIEGESSIYGSPVVDSSCSNGSRQTITISTDGEQLMHEWTLSAAFLQACAGRYFKAIMRFASGSFLSLWYRPAIYYGTGLQAVPLWVGPLVKFDSNSGKSLRDLAVLQLPPWLSALSDLDNLVLRLYTRRAVTTAVTVDLDYIYMMPVESFRLFEVNGAIPYTWSMVDDGITRQVYTQNASGQARKADVVSYGSPIMVHPGRLQRLYFLAHGIAGSGEISRTLQIRAWYRPRRLSV